MSISLASIFPLRYCLLRSSLYTAPEIGLALSHVALSVISVFSSLPSPPSPPTCVSLMRRKLCRRHLTRRAQRAVVGPNGPSRFSQRVSWSCLGGTLILFRAAIRLIRFNLSHESRTRSFGMKNIPQQVTQGRFWV